MGRECPDHFLMGNSIGRFLASKNFLLFWNSGKTEIWESSTNQNTMSSHTQNGLNKQSMCLLIQFTAWLSAYFLITWCSMSLMGGGLVHTVFRLWCLHALLTASIGKYRVTQIGLPYFDVLAVCQNLTDWAQGFTICRPASYILLW